jgi:hypothetical protein
MDGRKFFVPGFSAWLPLVLIGLSVLGFNLWALGFGLSC